MTDTSILIITIGVVLSTLIICITNFICAYYNDWKNEKINDKLWWNTNILYNSYSWCTIFMYS